MLIVLKNYCISDRLKYNILMQSKLVLIIFFIASIVLTPLNSVYAEEKSNLPKLIISEVQTSGADSGTSKNEFFELYNPLESDLDISGWKVVYTNSSGNDTDVINFDSYLVPSDAFIIVMNSQSADTFMKDIVADFTYAFGSSGLAATAGALSIYNELNEIVDYVKWTSAPSSEAENVVTGLVGGMSAQRVCDKLGNLLQDEDKKLNYIVSNPNPIDIPCLGVVVEDYNPKIPEDPIISDEPVVPEIPKEEPPLVIAEQYDVDINELFIDPSSPQTDSNDEFIELFNPNPVPADISGYRIEAGITTIYKHIFKEGTIMPPLGYLTIYSKDTTISMTNSGGRVSLYNLDNLELETVSYNESRQGESWSKNIAGVWEWSSTVTPDAMNIITKPIVTPQATNKKSTKSTSTQKTKTNTTVAPPVQLNEVYPDPASPQKDSEDEFIELYNPYPYSINIADYTIIAGIEKQYKYTLPEGSVIEGLGYFTVTSKSTSLSLNNTEGRVVVINNFNQEIDRTEYKDVKTGFAWARDDRGSWAWTPEVTKNQKNVINMTSVTNNAAKTIVSGAQVIGTEDTPLVPAPQPLPSWLLATMGICGLCYAAYEYRFEIKNKLYKLRAN